MARKKILLIAWEFPGYNSKQGTALSRRVGQLAWGLASEGYEVTVVHKDHIEECGISEFCEKMINEHGLAIHKIAIKGSPIKPNYWMEYFSFFRWINTLITSITIGDRSGYWANKSLKLLQNHIEVPSLIIGFFTPRGPVLLASMLSKRFKVPFIVDFQDTFDEGISSVLVPLTRYWTRKIVKRANIAVHVSPEWAQRDSTILSTKFEVIRHAVPPLCNLNLQKKISSKYFTCLYMGSLDKTYQDTSIFIEAFKSVFTENQKIEFLFAGSQNVSDIFAEQLEGKNYSYLGWLNSTELAQKIVEVDCLLLFGWSNSGRQVVPSKLYEYMSYNKPVLITGSDTGGIENLLSEWYHPNITLDTSVKIEEALREGVQNNYSNYLIPQKCKNVLFVNDMIKMYSTIIDRSVNN